MTQITPTRKTGHIASPKPITEFIRRKVQASNDIQNIDNTMRSNLMMPSGPMPSRPMSSMSFGRWRQQARLFAALEMLAQRKSVTEVSIAVGFDNVSTFIEMFRAMRGTIPQTILSKQAFVATRYEAIKDGLASGFR